MIDMLKSRPEVVVTIREAVETWGVFYMINHGIPDTVLDAMLDGLKRFHEQPMDSRRKYFTDDLAEEKIYTKISLKFDFCDDIIPCNQLFPSMLRKEAEEYAKYLILLKETLLELFSEALGLNSDYLSQMEFMKSATLYGNYYPACPQQDNSSGLYMHSDLMFMTINLQDKVGGLQVLHEEKWVDVPPKRGSLVVNLGDLMQLITNGKFKSVVHKVVNMANEPRVSYPCFFRPSDRTIKKPISPIKELLSDDNPPLYKEVDFMKIMMCYLSKEVKGLNTLNLPSFRI